MELSDLLNVFLRTIVGFILLIAAIKIMGKREIGQLGVFDFLIVLSIADIMIIGIENYESSIWLIVIPLFTIVMLQKLIAIIDLKFPNIRKKVDGKETLIIVKGKIDLKAMQKENYNMNDLYTQLREKNIRTIDEVEYAILETNGNLSVFTFDENTDNSFPLPLIVSGVVIESRLKLANKNKKWLKNELKRLNVKNIKDVYGASLKKDKLVIANRVK